jgi:hypothetical protein
MNRFLFLLLVLAVGCGPDATGYLETKSADVEQAEPEAVESPQVWTVCADEVATEFEPRLDEWIADALLYWQDEPGAERLKHTPGEPCDIPVTFTDETHWKGSKAAARVVTKGKYGPYRCKPVSFRIREKTWPEKANWGFFLVTHEVGHLLCLPHTELGIMAPDANLD